MNRFTLPLLAACIALASWAVWERSRRSELADENALLILKLAGAARQSATAAQQETEHRALTAKVAALEKQLAEGSGGTTGKTTSGKAEDSTADMAEGFVRMMRDPKMKDVMKTQARMSIDMLYRDLFDLLNLPEPQRSEFEKLIMEKATAGMEAGFALMSGEKTAEEKKAMAEEVKTKTADLEKKIKDLLGGDDYGKVKRYEASHLERMQLKTFTGMLTGRDLSVDETTETKLMDMMFQEREKFPFASNYVDQQNPDITRFTGENAERFNKEYAQMNDRITERAKSLLPEAQWEIFRESQNQHMNMIKMQMEWGARMFAGEGK